MSTVAAENDDHSTEPDGDVQVGATEMGSDAPVLDVEKPMGDLSLSDFLRTASRDYGKSYQDLIGDLMRLGFGPGQISTEEYISLRLFDDKGLQGVGKAEFIGAAANRKLYDQANFDHGWLGFVDDKLAFTTLMAGFGFPVTKTRAIFGRGAPIPSLQRFTVADDFAAYLRRDAIYPLFGKPVISALSLGAISADAYDPEDDALVLTSGGRTPVSSFVDEVAANYDDGYLIQDRAVPHTEIRKMCGNRAATVRVVTMRSQSGPQLWRSVWKIPAGDNAADNYWRSGNILAAFDSATGRITRASVGTGFELRELDRHPDTEIPIVGATVPNWDCVLATALQAAEILENVNIIGWDILPTDDGCLIIEANTGPDMALPQIAERRGVMDAQARANIAWYDERRKEQEAKQKQRQRKHKSKLWRQWRNSLTNTD